MKTTEILKRAEKAKYLLRETTKEEREEALCLMADELVKASSGILEANAKDLEKAKGRISEVMMDRLRLTKERINSMASDLRAVALLPDPVGKVLSETVRPNGLKIRKVTVPMGVIAVIYESRPNVTSDAASLALKAGSAAVLRSGKDAHESAEAIVDAMKKGLCQSKLPPDALFLVEDTSRASAEELMKARGYVDLLIPRGGKNLIRSCVENAIVPVLETGTGICHLFVDESADIETALNVIENAKTSRPSVCNAEEVLLIHEKAAGRLLKSLLPRLIKDRIEKGLTPVELKLSEKAFSYVDPEDRARYADQLKEAGPDDFDTEFLDYKLAVGIVSDVREAIDHINLHSTHHSDGILTGKEENAALFTQCVDSACCYVNASTRFTDGGEFGFGAEMGISTQKLHARGPVGLPELCSYKYVIEGSGQIR